MQKNRKLLESSLRNSNSLLMEEIKQSLHDILIEEMENKDNLSIASLQSLLEFRLSGLLIKYFDINKVKVVINSDNSCQVVLPLPHLIIFPPIKKVGENEDIGKASV